MPHQLNGLAKSNPYAGYNCLMRSAWSSLKECCKDPHNLGAIPGAVMVLHTFGSDLKYHIHVHALVSFWGIDDSYNWQWPKRKRKIIPFRQIGAVFRKHFLDKLKNIYDNLESRMSYDSLYDLLTKKSWCVHAEPPTTNTKILEEYLGRYICRIGLSKNRFHFDEVNKKVTILYKDYRHADQDTKVVPNAIKVLSPLVAIDQIMQHCLPAYYQKCRYYGIHASACKEKCRRVIPDRIKNNNQSVKTLFQILNLMRGLDGLSCESCKGVEFEIKQIKSDKSWIKNWLFNIPQNRGSPSILKYMNCIRSSRELERSTKINIEMIWLLKELTPDPIEIPEDQNMSSPLRSIARRHAKSAHHKHYAPKAKRKSDISKDQSMMVQSSVTKRGWTKKKKSISRDKPL